MLPKTTTIEIMVPSTLSTHSVIWVDKKTGENKYKKVMLKLYLPPFTNICAFRCAKFLRLLANGKWFGSTVCIWYHSIWLVLLCTKTKLFFSFLHRKEWKKERSKCAIVCVAFLILLDSLSLSVCIFSSKIYATGNE